MTGTPWLWLSLWLAATPTPPTSKPPFEGVTGAFFALSVAHLDASTKWYRDKFGLEVELSTKGDKSAVVVLSGGGLTVELIHPDAGTDSGKDPLLTHGFVKAGFVVGDLDRTLALLRARGVEIAFGPFPAKARSRSNVILKDNAGNLIQVFGK